MEKLPQKAITPVLGIPSTGKILSIAIVQFPHIRRPKYFTRFPDHERPAGRSSDRMDLFIPFKASLFPATANDHPFRSRPDQPKDGSAIRVSPSNAGQSVLKPLRA